MKLRYDISIEIDLATVPVPDLSDAATLAEIKQMAMAIAERQVDSRHAEIKERHKKGDK